MSAPDTGGQALSDQASDHEPSVVRITLNDPPSASAGGPYSVAEGGSVAVSATGSDPEGGALTYAWDLDDNRSFETSGQSATFSAAGLDGPSTHTITVQVTDPGGLSTTSQATVTVTNVAPTVSASFASPSVGCGTGNATLNASFTDPGPNTYRIEITLPNG